MLRFGKLRTWDTARKVKVVGRGCKRSFGPHEQEASCTGAKWGCTGAKEGLGGAKDSWETFAPRAQKSQKDLLHPPLTTFGDFPFLLTWAKSPIANRYPEGPKIDKIGSACGTVGKCAGPKRSRMVQTTIWVKMTLCRTGFSIRETKMDQNDPFWPKEVHFGPFRSANRTLAMPEEIQDRPPRLRCSISLEASHPPNPILLSWSSRGPD